MFLNREAKYKYPFGSLCWGDLIVVWRKVVSIGWVSLALFQILALIVQLHTNTNCCFMGKQLLSYVWMKPSLGIIDHSVMNSQQVNMIDGVSNFLIDKMFPNSSIEWDKLYMLTVSLWWCIIVFSFEFRCDGSVDRSV